MRCLGRKNGGGADVPSRDPGVCARTGRRGKRRGIVLRALRGVRRRGVGVGVGVVAVATGPETRPAAGPSRGRASDRPGGVAKEVGTRAARVGIQTVDCRWNCQVSVPNPRRAKGHPENQRRPTPLDAIFSSEDLTRTTRPVFRRLPRVHHSLFGCSDPARPQLPKPKLLGPGL